MVDSSKLFHQLRPVCVKVTKDPSTSNLNECLQQINQIENQSITEGALLEYLIFPFKLTLQKGKLIKEEQEILCFSLLKLIYTKCIPLLLTHDIALWNFNLISLYFGSIEISSKKTNSVISKLSEEQQYAVINLLETLSSLVDIKVYEKFYSTEKYLPIIGHLVSILLNVIQNEKLKKLQISAAKSLGYLSGIKFNNDQQKKIFGPIFSSFLPGIASKVKQVLSRDRNYGHQLISDILTLFAHATYIVVYDRQKTSVDINNLQSLFEQQSKEDEIEEATSNDTEKRSLKIDQSEKWLTTTSKNICIIMKDMFSVLLCNTHVKVQLSLLNLTDVFITKCMYNLSDIMPDCLDLLVKLSCSDFKEVSYPSMVILKKANKQFSKQGGNKLKSILDEKLYSLILSLPRLMNSANEEMKIAKLQIFKGYIQFYGDLLNNILNSSVQMERLLTSLLQILELETTDNRLVEEHSINLNKALNSSENNNRFYKKRFRYFTNTKIFEIIQDIIKYLTIYCDIDLLIDYLIENCRTSSILQKEAILLMNQITLNAADKLDYDTKALVEMLVALYLEDDLFNHPIRSSNQQQQQPQPNTNIIDCNNSATENNNFQLDTLSLETINSNIQLICLLIEGISIFSQLLKTEFNLLLMEVLYPLLEKVGSTNTNIHVSALETLHDITRNCGYENMSELIIINSDYLLNSITLEFRRLTTNSATSSVLCVILQYCTKDFLPIISDAIEDVFKVLDEYQDEVADDMLNVLKFLAMAVYKWYINADVKEALQNSVTCDKSVDSSNVFNNNVTVASFMSNYFDTFNHALGNVNKDSEEDLNMDDIQESDFKEEESEENVKKETPLQYVVVIKSMEKCIYFIASNTSTVKLKALDVTKYGILALQEREDDLLPLLHKLWPVIINQLKAKDQIIILKTLDVVCIMIQHSGDFLRKRISTDFLVYAIDFLKSNYKTITRDKSMYTQLHKVIYKLIQFLGDIIPVLKIEKELFCKVSSVCLMYIDSRLHDIIQQVAVTTLKKLHSYDSNILWLLLTSTWRESNTLKPLDNNNKLKELQFVNPTNKYMKENVMKIIKK